LVVTEQLIRKFVECYADIETNIRKGDVAYARQRYPSLRGLYEKINESSLGMHHKELAFEQITRVRDDLMEIDELPLKSKGAPAMIVAGLAIVFMSLLILVDPGIVGLTVFDPYITQDIGIEFSESGSEVVVLEGIPTSLAITGDLASGSAKIFAQLDDERLLVLDTKTALLVNGRFTNICDKTCDFTTNSRTIPLIVELEGGPLQIESITYARVIGDNRAPVWTSERTSFTLDKRLRIDLKNYFDDPDGDRLVYLATSAPGIKMTVEDSILEIEDVELVGNAKITFIASDLDQVTRVPVTLVKS
jgi:hypothetical protein